MMSESEEDYFRSMAEEGVDSSSYMIMGEEPRMMLSEEDCFRSMAEEGLDPSYEENLPTFRAEITRSLRELERQMQCPADDMRDHLLAFSQLDWAESFEDSTADVITIMADDGDCCRRGAAFFAANEPALAETLRVKAAWLDATRAEVGEVAASARHLRGVCLRVLATAKEFDVVYLAAMEYFTHVARDTPRDGDCKFVFRTEAVADQVHAAAVEGARDPAVKRLVEGFAERAGRLRRDAVEFGCEDQVFAEQLMELAAMVEALCVDTETFVHQVVSSPFWRFWRAFNCGR